MKAEALQAMMDIYDLTDREVAKKLGVKHPTVIRWRRDLTDIPQIATIAIDNVFGDGKQAVETIVRSVLRSRWQEFVTLLDAKALGGIACGVLAVRYSSGHFNIDMFSEESDDLVYWGDICGCEGPFSWGFHVAEQLSSEKLDSYKWDDIVKFLSTDNKFESSAYCLNALVAEAMRSEMLTTTDIDQNVFEMISDATIEKFQHEQTSEEID